MEGARPSEPAVRCPIAETTVANLELGRGTEKSMGTVLLWIFLPMAKRVRVSQFKRNVVSSDLGAPAVSRA